MPINTYKNKTCAEYHKEYRKQKSKEDPEWLEKRREQVRANNRKHYMDIKNTEYRQLALEISQIVSVDELAEFLKNNVVFRRKEKNE